MSAREATRDLAEGRSQSVRDMKAGRVRKGKAPRSQPLEHTIRVVDPQGEEALSLLREAAVEARALYPELHSEGAPWPGNSPTPPGGTYVIAYASKVPVGCGALRPIDSAVVEVRRMYVLKDARRHGVARKVLAALESSAARMGYEVMRLETGDRQAPAMALYESFGFERITPFGDYADDPTSVCYEKRIATSASA
jgi:putative acetyltransferase